MDLLERYLAAVQQELPKEKQQDVTRELKANILDQLDALQAQAPGQSAEQYLVQVLQELGPPKQMADRFHPPQPLIRAELIPLFRFTLFMVLGIIFLINVVQSTLLWLGHEQMGLFLLLKHMASGFIGDATLAFTGITLGFWSMSKEQKNALLDDSPAEVQPGAQYSTGNCSFHSGMDQPVFQRCTGTTALADH